MIFTETRLAGAFIIDVDKIEDPRGFFGRSWCEKEAAAHGITARMVQSNVSLNVAKGTLRGLHFQRAPFGENKLVRCTRGAVLDVIVDLRPGSPTQREWIAVELEAGMHRMIYVPEGFGHGYQTLSENSELFYQVSQYYSSQHSGGVAYDDPAFRIVWPLPVTALSEADRNWPAYNTQSSIQSPLLTQ